MARTWHMLSDVVHVCVRICVGSGFLQNGVTAEERRNPKLLFPWPVADKPTFFYASLGQEEYSSTGTDHVSHMPMSHRMICTGTGRTYGMMFQHVDTH